MELDLGFVGDPAHVDTTVLDQVLGRELIPVLAPVCQGADGETIMSMPIHLLAPLPEHSKPSALLFLTDVPGVLDKNKQLIKELNIAQIRALSPMAPSPAA